MSLSILQYMKITIVVYPTVLVATGTGRDIVLSSVVAIVSTETDILIRSHYDYVS